MSAVKKLEEYISKNQQSSSAHDSLIKPRLQRSLFLPKRADTTTNSRPNANRTTAGTTLIKNCLESELQDFVLHLKAAQAIRSAQMKQVNELLSMEMGIEEQMDLNILSESQRRINLSDEEFESYLLGAQVDEENTAPPNMTLTSDTFATGGADCTLLESHDEADLSTAQLHRRRKLHQVQSALRDIANGYGARMQRSFEGSKRNVVTAERAVPSDGRNTGVGAVGGGGGAWSQSGQSLRNNSWEMPPPPPPPPFPDSEQQPPHQSALDASVVNSRGDGGGWGRKQGAPQVLRSQSRSASSQHTATSSSAAVAEVVAGGGPDHSGYFRRRAVATQRALDQQAGVVVAADHSAGFVYDVDVDEDDVGGGSGGGVSLSALAAMGTTGGEGTLGEGQPVTPPSSPPSFSETPVTPLSELAMMTMMTRSG